jgi:hypothetical protein
MKASSILVPRLVAGLLFFLAACTSPVERVDGAARPSSASPQQAQVIQHLVPKRDSVGGVPPRFEWSKVANADRYTFGLWNEVDVMVWRQTGITTNSVEWPKELDVEPGTYYWSVAALRDDRPIAESGLSAFVIR